MHSNLISITNTEPDFSEVNPLEEFIYYYQGSLARAQEAMRNEPPSESEIWDTINRLNQFVCSPEEDPDTTILIQTYNPTRLLHWTLDQIARQQIHHGTKFGINIFHNGLQNGSDLPPYIEEIVSNTKIHLDEIQEPLGVWGALNNAMAHNYQSGRLNTKSGIFFHMDDDTGPVSPYWLENAIKGFDPRVGAMFFPALYYGKPEEMRKLMGYKAVTLSVQAMRQMLHRTHLTDGMSGYRTNALFPQLLEQENLKKVEVRHRADIVRCNGYKLTQRMALDSVFLTDPSRITQSGSMLKHFSRVAKYQSGIESIQNQAKREWKRMYDKKDEMAE